MSVLDIRWISEVRLAPNGIEEPSEERGWLRQRAVLIRLDRLSEQCPVCRHGALTGVVFGIRRGS